LSPLGKAKDKSDMKSTSFYLTFVLMLLLTLRISYAQEDDKLDVEESAEVFLEEYTDEFQEKFFEALKQKGIHNYDRAIDLLLECKELKPDNSAINHELAKAYFLDKQYISAQQYAIEALVLEPDNYWYLDTLVSILEKQFNTIGSLDSTLPIPLDEAKLQENLVRIYYKRRKYKDALALLSEMPASNFKEQLTLKINGSNAAKKEKTEVKSTSFMATNSEPTTKGLELDIKSKLELEQYSDLEKAAKDAVEAYPLQPFFYYAYGTALYKNKKNKEAIEVLESSLDYLFDDIPLANKIYKMLSDAYTKANNASKANLYLSKIKPGF